VAVVGDWVAVRGLKVVREGEGNETWEEGKGFVGV
jgi:hypothetical protein